jgi:hypothetical protein
MTVQVHTIVMFLSLILMANEATPPLMSNAAVWLGGLDFVDAEVETSSFRACPVRLLTSLEVKAVFAIGEAFPVSFSFDQAVVVPARVGCPHN